MDTTATYAHKGRRRPVKRVGRAVTVLAAVGMLTTACSHSSAGPAVAGGGSSTPSGRPSSSGSAGNAMAYSQCMRAHGIGDFPDPNAQGQIVLKVTPGSDLSKENPRFQAAQKACQALQPQESEQQQQQDTAQLLNFAKCMRAHGITNFPDPGGHGLNLQGSGLDPHSPQFQAAQHACRQFLPGNLTPGSGSKS